MFSSHQPASVVEMRNETKKRLKLSLWQKLKRSSNFYCFNIYLLKSQYLRPVSSSANRSPRSYCVQIIQRKMDFPECFSHLIKHVIKSVCALMFGCASVEIKGAVSPVFIVTLNSQKYIFVWT